MNSRRWRPALRFAALRGVPPAAFWRLSLVEWRALSESVPGEGMNRAEFAALMRRFPDERLNT